MEDTYDLEEARASVIQAASAFRQELDQASQAVAREAGILFSPGTRVLTLSASSTVRRALLLHGVERSLHVTCLEGRPMSEGHNLARSLGRAGISVVLAVDAAGGTLAKGCDLILVGADSVGDVGVVNKIGTQLLAWAGRELGTPVHVLVDRTKLLPPGFPQAVDDDRPPKEVWTSPPGVKTWNRYFEIVPLTAISSLVTDEGVLTPQDLLDLRSGIPVPPELRQWASGRRSGPDFQDFEPKG